MTVEIDIDDEFTKIVDRTYIDDDVELLRLKISKWESSWRLHRIEDGAVSAELFKNKVQRFGPDVAVGAYRSGAVEWVSPRG